MANELNASAKAYIQWLMHQLAENAPPTSEADDGEEMPPLEDAAAMVGPTAYFTVKDEADPHEWGMDAVAVASISKESKTAGMRGFTAFRDYSEEASAVVEAAFLDYLRGMPETVREEKDDLPPPVLNSGAGLAATTATSEVTAADLPPLEDESDIMDEVD